MGNDLPFFPMYAGDFVTAVASWPAERVGAYWLCLLYQWDHGSVPADDLDDLARVMHESRSKAQLLWRQIGSKFPKTSVGYQNIRLEEVRREVIDGVETSSRRGKAGAQARWGKRSGNAQASTRALPGQSLSNGIQSQSQIQEPPLTPLSGGDRLLALKPITRGERTWAMEKRYMQGSVDNAYCLHDPRCANDESCIGRLVGEKRLEEHTALAEAVKS